MSAPRDSKWMKDFDENLPPQGKKKKRRREKPKKSRPVFGEKKEDSKQRNRVQSRRGPAPLDEEYEFLDDDIDLEDIDDDWAHPEDEDFEDIEDDANQS
jgi:hypothetical protein